MYIDAVTCDVLKIEALKMDRVYMGWSSKEDIIT